MFYNNYVRIPRGTPALRRQIETVDGLIELKGTRLTKKDAEYFKKLNQLLREETGFKDGDQILSIYSYASVIYCLGGVSPGIPWHFIQRTRLNCAILKDTPIDTGRLIVFVNDRPRKRFLRCMRRAGINYPHEYEYVGKAG